MGTGFGRRLQKRQKEIEGFIFVFRWIFFCILLTLLLFALLASVVLKPVLEEQAIEHTQQTLVQLEAKFTDVCDNAKEAANYVILAENCSPLLNAVSEKSLVGEVVTKGLRQMRLIASNSKYIDSIVIMNRKAGICFSTDMIPVISSTEDVYEHMYMDWIGEEHVGAFTKKTIQLERNGMAISLPHEVYSYVAANNYEDDVLQSAVVINVSLDYFRKYVRDTVNLGNGYLQLTDAEGAFIQFDEAGFFAETEVAEVFREMEENNISVMEKRVLGEKYTMFSFNTGINGVSFQMGYKSNEVYDTLNSVLGFIGLFFLVIFVFGIGLSYVLAGLIHGKYKEKEDTYLQMQERAAKNVVFARHKFWQDYLTGRTRYSQTDFQRRLQELGLNELQEGSLLLCLNQADNHAAGQEVSAEELNASVERVFLEVFQEFSPVLLFSTNGYELFFLQIAETPKKERLQELMEDFRREAPCGVGFLADREIYTPEHFPEVWNGLSRAIPQMFFYSDDEWRDYRQVLAEHEDSQIKIDMTILDRISYLAADNNLEKANLLLEEYESCLRGGSYENYFNCMTLLILNIEKLLNRKQEKLMLDGDRSGRFEEFCRSARNCTRVEQYISLVRQYMKDAVLFLSDNREVEWQNDKVKMAYNYIRNHYADAQLTKADVADWVGMSPNYLNKIFKDETGRSIQEYINSLRLRQAAERIENTEESIQDIAVSCGFINANYFYTCFKKHYGITPGTYREMKMKDRSPVQG